MGNEIGKLISEGLEDTFGEVAFGDKESGYKIGFYKEPLEVDDPHEKEVFDKLKYYFREGNPRGEKGTKEFNVSTIFQGVNVDVLRNKYPNVFELPSNIKYGQEIYRGLRIPTEILNKYHLSSKIKNGAKNLGTGNPLLTFIVIENVTIKHLHNIQSWTTDPEMAIGFARGGNDLSDFSYVEGKETDYLPVILMTAIDYNFFMNPDFVYKMKQDKYAIDEKEIFHYGLHSRCHILVPFFIPGIFDKGVDWNAMKKKMMKNIDNTATVNESEEIEEESIVKEKTNWKATRVAIKNLLDSKGLKYKMSNEEHSMETNEKTGKNVYRSVIFIRMRATDIDIPFGGSWTDVFTLSVNAFEEEGGIDRIYSFVNNLSEKTDEVNVVGENFEGTDFIGKCNEMIDKLVKLYNVGI